MKTAGDAAGRVEAFLEVHAEREEVDALARSCGTDGAQHERIAGADGDRAAGQIASEPLSNDDLAAADGDV
jgi:hypothetical protein